MLLDPNQQAMTEKVQIRSPRDSEEISKYEDVMLENEGSLQTA